ncbi:MAG: nucleoside hydrolase [Polyangiales bacterium]
MDLIVETDLGRDPDDFFALCYLVDAGVKLRAVVISPGDRDQVAVARGLFAVLGLDVPVGSARLEGERSSAGGVHLRFLARYGLPDRCAPDGAGHDVIADARARHPEAELFVCGPMQNVGRHLAAGGARFPRATVQGGFLAYAAHAHAVLHLQKFEGLETVPTFNLNGDVKGAVRFLESATPTHFVGKNVCHTVVYDRARHEDVTATPAKSRAGEVLREVMGMYLEGHAEKMFHDPTAAVCHLHPEIGLWVEGTPYRQSGGWGTRVGRSPHRALADIDRDALWRHLREGT